MKLRIAYLYPELLNLYGDRGNILCLTRRCAWRGIEAEVVTLDIGQAFKSDSFDMVFIGGGQDSAQTRLTDDLMNLKGPELCRGIEADLPVLAICGGYQLLGRFYRNTEGEELPGLGILDVHTTAGSDRMIGNLLAESPLMARLGLDSRIYGFENHAGQTFLGPKAEPFAMVTRGKGNNGTDGTEGAVYKNCIGTYCHGSFLPRNPAVADLMILSALKRRGYEITALTEVDDRPSIQLRKELAELPY